MYLLRYRITAQSPIVISMVSGDMNMVATKKYIPGSSALGLLAKRFIDRDKKTEGSKAHENDNFYSLFLAGGMKFSNAYIFWRDEYDNEFVHYPTPLSIEKEKYNDNVYDRLFSIEDKSEKTKHVGDFCFLEKDTLQTRAVETEINFHHARGREKGISKKGIIFNYESIVAGQVFEGIIQGHKNDLQNLLDTCGNDWPDFIGRSKNSQYGAIEFQIIDKEPVQRQNQISWPKESVSMSMTLLSDLILYNDYGYPTPDVSCLEKTLRQHLGEVEIEKAFVKKTEVENFVGIWRLKKPSDVCFAAGSAFLLKVKHERLDALAMIQETGIGERTHEGFGRCAFGWQTHDELFLRDEIEEEAKEEAQKPEGSPPEIVKDIVEEVIRKTIHEHMALKAINKQEEFNRLPSSSLIARLHAMAKNAADQRDMTAKFIDLREIAANQLRRCVSGEYNLMEFLAAFHLKENAAAKLEQNGFDTKKVELIKKRAINKQFTLIEDLRKYLELSKEEKFTEAEKELILKYASIIHDPVVWDDFFRQRKDADIKPLCREIGFEPESDVEFKHALTKVFYTTFFAEMRKRKIAEKEGKND